VSGAVVGATCPACGARSEKVPAELVGRSVRCPRCRAVFRVLGAAAAAPLATRPEEALATTPEAPIATTPEAATAPARTAAPVGGWKEGDVILGLYQVTGLLGQGGMGRVYRVRHRGWNLDLALKAPRPEVLEAAGGVVAFEREAETWVGLGLHPHVVTCHYVRRIGGVPCVLAEFADGGSLHDRISEATPLEVLLDRAIQFAWGLHYAHEQGLVHRDVKPANVLLGSDGLVKVTDFGLARGGPLPSLAPTAAGGGTLVVAGGAAGTPAYMSPEQLAGRPLTRRSDLWSWALSVLETFLGGRNWDYGSAAPSVLEEALARGKGSRPAIPDAAVDLFRRCFQEEEAARPHDLDEAAAVLIGAFESAVGRAYPRTRPALGRGSADSLNNSAVSLLDLDRAAEAVALWTRALEAQPQHLEATFNRSVHEWALGALDDAELARRFGAARKSHAAAAWSHHLAARLHASLGDFTQALADLDEAARHGAAEADLARERALAHAGQAAQREDAAAFTRAREAVSLTLRPGEVEALDLPGQERSATLRGLAAGATTLAVTPDAEQIVGGGGGREARVWGRGAAPLRKIVAEDGRLRALAILPGARLLLWAADDAPLRVYDLAQGRLLRALPRTGGSLLCLAPLPDGRRVVAGSSDRTLRVFDVDAGQCVRTLEGHEDAVLAVAAGTASVASASRDGSVRVWDAETGSPLAVHRGHAGRVQAVAIDEPRQRLASGGEDQTVRLWPWGPAGEARVLRGAVQPVTSVAFDTAGRFLAWGSQDRSLRFFDLQLGRVHAVLRMESGLHALVPTREGFVVGHGSTVSRVAIPELPRLPPPALARPVSSSEAQERQAEFERLSAEARAQLAADALDKALPAARAARAVPGFDRAPSAIALWESLLDRLPRASLEAAWEASPLVDGDEPVLALAAAGGVVAFGGADGALRLAPALGGADPRVLRGHEAAVGALALTPDGRRLASGSWDQTLRLWDAASGRCLAVCRGHDGYVIAAAVAPDGRRLASGSLDQSLRLWNADGSAARSVPHEAPVAALAWSPDGRVLVSGGWDGAVRLWDDQGGTLGALVGHQGNVTAVAAAGAGALVASGGADGLVRLWDARARREISALGGHASEIASLAFTADGRFLAAASRDASVRLWRVGGAAPIQVLTHPAPVTGVAFGPGDHRLFTGSPDGRLRVFRLLWEPEAPEPKLRLKPQTIRESPATVRPSAPLAPAAPAADWEGVRRSGATLLRAPAVKRPLPWGAIVKGALAAVILAASVLAWRGTRPGLHLVEHLAASLRSEPDLIRLEAFQGDCGPAGMLERLERVRAADVAAPDIACLAALQDPGIVDRYFATMDLSADDAFRAKSLYRNAVSLMAGLGAPAAEALCGRLGDPREDVRRVAGVALSAQSTAEARACLLREAASGATPLARATAIGALPRLLAHGGLGVPQGYEAVRSALRDADPDVRRAALQALPIFSQDFARPLAEAAKADPDADVRAAADAALVAIADARRGEALQGVR